MIENAHFNGHCDADVLQGLHRRDMSVVDRGARCFMRFLREISVSRLALAWARLHVVALPPSFAKRLDRPDRWTQEQQGLAGSRRPSPRFCLFLPYLSLFLESLRGLRSSLHSREVDVKTYSRRLKEAPEHY